MKTLIVLSNHPIADLRTPICLYQVSSIFFPLTFVYDIYEDLIDGAHHREETTMVATGAFHGERERTGIISNNIAAALTGKQPFFLHP